MNIIRVDDGIYELHSVGYDIPSFNAYKYADGRYKSALGGAASPKLIIAVLTSHQRAAQKFLRLKGFKRIGKGRRNPNSGYMNYVYIKRVINRGKKQ